MKKVHCGLLCVGGVLVAGIVGWKYYQNKSKGVRSSLTSTGANASYYGGGYSAMMRGANNYDQSSTFSGGSMLNAAEYGAPVMNDPEDSSEWEWNLIPTPWTLPAIGNDGGEISGLYGGRLGYDDFISRNWGSKEAMTNVGGSHL